VARLPIYGLMAEFDSPEALLEASRRAFAEGFRRMDAYSPFPVDGLAEAIGFPRTRVPLIVLIGGIVGCIGGFWLQYWVSVIDYPINIGGRPLNSWPSFIPVTFELTILLAALAAFFSVLGLNRLPMPYHPVFNVERFELASRNRFFLCIEAADKKFELERTRRFLDEIGSLGTYEVEP
jgi:Alternative complex III, ActD subunit